MKFKTAKLLIYLILGLLSVIFISLYWCDNISLNTRTVLMSIGASLIGGVVLSILLDLSALLKIKKEKDNMLESLKACCKSVIEELDNVFSDIKSKKIINEDFTDAKDFINKSMKKYMDLCDDRNDDNDKKRREMFDSIKESIIDSFIIDVCKNSLKAFEKIIDNQSLLIVSRHLSNDEAKIISKAYYRIDFFVKDFEENKYSILSTNNLNFRDLLVQIIEF